MSPSTASSYRALSEEADAIRWTGDNLADVAHFLGVVPDVDPENRIVIPSPEHDLLVEVGRWIIERGGGFYSTATDKDFHVNWQAIEP